MMLHGVWHVYGKGERWRRPAYKARAVLQADNGVTAVCFDAPVVELRRDDTFRPRTRAGAALERLGPNLCDETVDLDEVLRRASALPSETPIGDALLDQRVASGAGNVFKSEICWAERVHPMTPLVALDADIRRRLFETAHRQLFANRAGGRRVTYRGGLAVYGKVRRPCPRCRTAIRRAWTGADQRVTYWCPQCQPGARRHVNAAGVSVPAHVRPVLALRQGCARHRRQPRHRLDDRPRLRRGRRPGLHLVPEGRRVRRGRRRALEDRATCVSLPADLATEEACITLASELARARVVAARPRQQRRRELGCADSPSSRPMRGTRCSTST